MPKLKSVVDTLEGMSEEVQSLYVERADGKFVLDAEGVEDVGGLKSALERERRARREAEGRASKLPENFDADDYQQLLSLREEMQRGKLTDKQREELDNMKKQLLDQNAKEKARFEGEIQRLRQALHRELITSRASQAIAAAKGSVRLLLPHVERQAKVVDQEDGSFVPVIVDDKGHVRITGDGGGNMSFDELITEMRASKDYASAFEGTGSSGGGASRSTAGGGSVGKTVVAAGDNAAFIKNLEGIAKGEVVVRQG